MSHLNSSSDLLYELITRSSTLFLQLMSIPANQAGSECGQTMGVVPRSLRGHSSTYDMTAIYYCR